MGKHTRKLSESISNTVGSARIRKISNSISNGVANILGNKAKEKPTKELIQWAPVEELMLPLPVAKRPCQLIGDPFGSDPFGSETGYLPQEQPVPALTINPWIIRKLDPKDIPRCPTPVSPKTRPRSMSLDSQPANHHHAQASYESTKPLLIKKKLRRNVSESTPVPIPPSHGSKTFTGERKLEPLRGNEGAFETQEVRGSECIDDWNYRPEEDPFMFDKHQKAIPLVLDPAHVASPMRQRIQSLRTAMSSGSKPVREPTAGERLNIGYPQVLGSHRRPALSEDNTRNEHVPARSQHSNHKRTRPELRERTRTTPSNAHLQAASSARSHAERYETEPVARSTPPELYTREDHGQHSRTRGPRYYPPSTTLTRLQSHASPQTAPRQYVREDQERHHSGGRKLVKKREETPAPVLRHAKQNIASGSAASRSPPNANVNGTGNALSTAPTLLPFPGAAASTSSAGRATHSSPGQTLSSRDPFRNDSESPRSPLGCNDTGHVQSQERDTDSPFTRSGSAPKVPAKSTSTWSPSANARERPPRSQPPAPLSPKYVLSPGQLYSKATPQTRAPEIAFPSANSSSTPRVPAHSNSTSGLSANAKERPPRSQPPAPLSPKYVPSPGQVYSEATSPARTQEEVFPVANSNSAPKVPAKSTSTSSPSANARERPPRSQTPAPLSPKYVLSPGQLYSKATPQARAPEIAFPSTNSSSTPRVPAHSSSTSSPSANARERPPRSQPPAPLSPQYVPHSGQVYSMATPQARAPEKAVPAANSRSTPRAPAQSNPASSPSARARPAQTQPLAPLSPKHVPSPREAAPQTAHVHAGEGHGPGHAATSGHATTGTSRPAQIEMTDREWAQRYVRGEYNVRKDFRFGGY